MSLMHVIPDPDVLIGLPPEELARVLLKLAKENERNGVFHPMSVLTPPPGPSRVGYPNTRMAEIESAVQEAWAWLRVHIMIVDAPDPNGSNGWLMLTRRGRALANDERAFDSYRNAAAFSRELLHSAIADQAWIELARGNLDGAVFNAFKAVEVAVRDASGLTARDIGVPLMRKAFNKDGGPLTDMSQEEGEREGLMHLFAGAIGSYKNPHSHRTVCLSDHREAQEMILIASHLLRIVDAARARKAAASGART